MKLKRLIHHIEKWNEWRKYCMNSKWHKIAVLLGVTKSPTFELTLTKKDRERCKKDFEKFLKEQ